MWPRALVAAALLATALACGGAPVPGEVTAAPVVPIVPIAAAPPEIVVPEIAVPEIADTDVQKDPVEAYLQDCFHVFPAGDPDLPGDNPGDECLWVEFDQNCSPDVSGCWEKGQGCEAACGVTCGECQGTCGGACESCKSACGTDGDCLRGCAESRATCRDGCLGAKGTCTDDGCPSEYMACEAAFEVTKAERCPLCPDIASCLMESWSRSEYDSAACRNKLPDVASECWDWCSPGY